MDWVSPKMSSLTTSEELGICDSSNCGVVTRTMHHDMTTILICFTVWGSLDFDIPRQKTNLNSDMWGPISRIDLKISSKMLIHKWFSKI